MNIKYAYISLLIIASTFCSYAQSNLPLIDISSQKEMQVVISAGTEKLYNGHPTTVLMSDSTTILCTWSYNHGGHNGPLAKSSDGGKTWQRVETPKDWEKTYNCPSIYRLTDQKGKERLFVFSARPNMSSTYSEDGGLTWSPVKSLNKPCVMAFSSIIKLKDGRYLGMYHRGLNDNDRPPLSLWQAVSEDGGLTWGESTMVGRMSGRCPCEPCMFRDPSGKRIICIARENLRKGHSLMMYSDDEGVTWSNLKETPWGLTGDRHVIRYAHDGRLVAVFRDMAPGSPTKGHFVAWVGTYNDVINGCSGQYKIKLLHSFAGPDCGYPGLEVLKDGTMVATTYIKYKPGSAKHSIVSVRFKLDEIDKMYN